MSQFSIMNDILNDKKDYNIVNDKVTALLISQMYYLLMGREIYTNEFDDSFPKHLP